ncbi:MAG: hypothetical protein OEZ02_04240 [Anaerolineae bacterium]|nr:hypothetical protein [Anaerolineae bacterium]
MSKHTVFGLGIISAISLSGYVLASAQMLEIGFPLDDAWIHQTYARNLALRGEWAFFPGHPSAGSTSPLWAVLLAAGYVINGSPIVFSFVLGWALLWGLSLVGVKAFQALVPARSTWAFGAGALLALEWHLVWAAGSGMETLLFALSALLVWTWLLKLDPPGEENPGGHWLGLGLLIAASVWVRPEGITLLGPVGLAAWLWGTSWRQRLRSSMVLLLGFGLGFVPYLVFNLQLSGEWWPNTFFAKQAEYAPLLAQPLWERVLQEVSLPLVGVGVLLLPGMVYLTVQAARQKKWPTLLGAAWLVGHILLYALRLPVTYQHGRYLIPVMPVYFVLGAAGLAAWVQPRGRVFLRRMTSLTWIVSSAVVLVVFWFSGAGAYARDVAYIQSEMVVTAHWVAENLPPDDLIAAHDIGALGYFAPQKIVDLAGLVSPDVIPFIRDEDRMAAYIDSQQAAYLVTFPGWYPILVGQATLIYSTGGEISPQIGGENMAVYIWERP